MYCMSAAIETSGPVTSEARADMSEKLIDVEGEREGGVEGEGEREEEGERGEREEEGEKGVREEEGERRGSEKEGESGGAEGEAEKDEDEVKPSGRESVEDSEPFTDPLTV